MKQLNVLVFKAKEMPGDKDSKTGKIVILTYSVLLFLVTFCSFTVTGLMAMIPNPNNNATVKPSTNRTVTTQPSKGVVPKPSNDFLAPYNKGLALLEVGKYNESIVYFDKALAINPKYVGSLDSKGAALFNLGKYNESIVYFDKALAINPNYLLSLYNKGAVLNKLGKYNESIVYFDKVLAIKPTNSHALAGKQLDLAALSKINTGTTTTPQNPSEFGFYFGSRVTNATGTPPANAHTEKTKSLTCDQPGHSSCYSFGYSEGLLNTRVSCSATLNSFFVANPSQVNSFCSGYRIAQQQALQQQR